MGFYKDQSFANFANEINLGYIEAYEEAYITEFRELNKQHNHQRIIEVNLHLQYAPKVSDFLKLLYALKRNRGLKYQVVFTVYDYVIDAPMFREYIMTIITEKAKFNKFKNLYQLLIEKPTFLYVNHDSQDWYIFYDDFSLQSEINEAVEFLTKKMHEFGYLKFKIWAKWHEKEVIDNSPEVDLSEVYNKLKAEQTKVIITQNSNSKYRKANRKEYFKTTISEIANFDTNRENHPISFEGLIYKTDVIERTNLKIYKYNITDLTDAISATQFVSVNDFDYIKPFNVDDYVKINGMVTFSQVGSELKKSVKIDVITKIESPFTSRTDEAVIKRVELNTKSKMNAMDSVFDVSNIVKIAKQFGHKAVAVMDSNSVQSFPKFVAEAKKAGIKPIYGASFDMIDSNNQIILTQSFNKEADLLAAEYVVFDIETTSLSPKLGEIIEFGATIIKNTKQVKSEQFFIKSKQPLSQFTKNLTNITQEMIDQEGLQLNVALDKIYEILNNKVAVAHNANFDMHFIFQKFIDAKRPLPNTIFLDSLMVSRILFSEKNKHSLGDFCKYFDINYDSQVAHRADYDAEILSRAFVQALYKFKENNVITFDDLYNYLPDAKNFYRRIRAINSQYSIIVKNQDGLRDLFKLISLTLTQRFWGQPKLFYTDIKKNKNLLIGSGGLKGELIYALLYSSDIKINEIIDRCDYIEIPHIDALKHYYQKSEYSKAEIESLLNELIQLAISKNKIIVAISDSRYENQGDQIYYKNLVYTKGLGGSRHFLLRTKNSEKEQDSTFEDETKRDKVKKIDMTVVPDLYFLTTKEMLDGFAFLNNPQLAYDIVIKNTNLIADMIDEDIVVIKDKLYPPVFDNSKTKLKNLVYQTAKEKYGENLPEIIQQRIKSELNPILEYNFDVIYWISHILVKKSLDNGYLVGSRGSVGSSLVATLAGITEVNPLPPHYICDNCKYFELVANPPTTSGFDLDDKHCPKCNFLMDKDGNSIPFETFLGFKADKVPDIDLNFSGDYQKNIHDEIKLIFGEDKTFRAGTISTIKGKTGFGYIKKVCEEFGFNYSNDFIDFLSSKLEDVKRTTGQHPGGIIIIPNQFIVEDFTPINYPADDVSLDWKTTHFDYRAIHDNIIKFDILGHVDPTAIRMLENLTGINVKTDIPKKDPKVMSLFSTTEAMSITPAHLGGESTGALGLPEFGTAFVRKMLHDAQPRSFADLISLSGLSHGTDVWKGNAQDLIKKEGMKLNEVISCRDDIMNFLIQIGVEPLYAFNIMEKVRKGKGLTSDEETHLKACNVPEWAIHSMKLIKYMFPKAHATAYVLMAWRVAWFKLYKPLEYYATYFSTRVEEFELETLINDTEITKINRRITELNALKDPKVNEKELLTTLEIARECYARGFKIANINLKTSKAKEWVIDYQNKCLIPPFTSIKNLGLSAAEKIIIARDERDFLSKEDFKIRSGINQTLFKKIEEFGILDHLSENDQMKLF
ncbi:DNA polymerase-3 subunit alpha (Gram-positive type) [Mycoplasmopsis mustelae]|uniref:DNA polymerase III PolC-type n=1 Tax=Mycoplasmopsis mustelae TaxID=171289 RepID=A0A4R7UDK1_9BACT|nr:PolC-type DNA polymerase III [Mycoplasmopsis mustelae]TDV23036.1 DNA polymerase-3 subunit alpha (Gram-positive type) [Mycoplasmopsis mustelae]